MHPQKIGKFEIVQRLAPGGMARVYKAIDTASSQSVALKLVDQGPDRESMEIVEAERTGAMLQSRLCGLDRRVTRIEEYGDLDGYFYISMEFIEGQDLSDVLADKPIGIPFACRIAADVCEVLSHAHTLRATIDDKEFHGIVHGDLKPRNIRITNAGEVRVLDFGIAKALSLTRRFTHNQFGSVQYSSPERLDTGIVDAASDLWAVGVMLYEMTAQQPYFAATDASRLEHEIRNYRTLKSLPPHLPEGLRNILARALAPNASDRYPSAAAFAADLNAFREGQPIAAPVPSEPEPDATRRTVAADAADFATRRTVPPSGAAPRAVDRPKRKAVSRAWRYSRRGIALALTVLAAYLFVNEVRAYQSGSQLARELESDQLRDLETAWKRYSEIESQSRLGIGTERPRRVLKERLLAEAERVAAEYRQSDSPRVTESDWNRARDHAQRALAIAPGDKLVLGRLRLSEGHLDRIHAASRKQPKLYGSAQQKFQESASMLPKSPDPYLGLARVYAYAIRDVDRTEHALREAENRGYELGRRELTQLADAYQDRGNQLVRESARATSKSEEKDLLKKADKDLKRAGELYESVLPFGQTAASLRKVNESRDEIDDRLDKLGGWFPW